MILQGASRELIHFRLRDHYEQKIKIRGEKIRYEMEQIRYLRMDANVETH